jgi:hypothetical protein
LSSTFLLYSFFTTISRVNDDHSALAIPNQFQNNTSVTTTVKPVNHPPVANAGVNQTVSPGDIATLDGSKSVDPDNDPIKYLWKQVVGPAVELNGADTPIATFTAPLNISTDTDLTFELIVTDSKNATDNATVKVTDKYVPPPNQSPIANAGQDQSGNGGDQLL